MKKYAKSSLVRCEALPKTVIDQARASQASPIVPPNDLMAAAGDQEGQPISR